LLCTISGDFFFKYSTPAGPIWTPPNPRSPFSIRMTRPSGPASDRGRSPGWLEFCEPFGEPFFLVAGPSAPVIAGARDGRRGDGVLQPRAVLEQVRSCGFFVDLRILLASRECSGLRRRGNTIALRIGWRSPSRATNRSWPFLGVPPRFPASALLLGGGQRFWRTISPISAETTPAARKLSDLGFLPAGREKKD